MKRRRKQNETFQGWKFEVQSPEPPDPILQNQCEELQVDAERLKVRFSDSRLVPSMVPGSLARVQTVLNKPDSLVQICGSGERRSGVS